MQFVGTHDKTAQEQAMTEAAKAEYAAKQAEKAEATRPAAAPKPKAAKAPKTKVAKAKGKAAKAKSPKPKATKGKAKGKAKSKVATPRGPLPDNAKRKITVLSKENPKREGTASWQRFKLYKSGMTVGDFIGKGGTMGDIRWDQKHGFIKVSAK